MIGQYWSQKRSWTRYRKLSDEHILALKFIGQNKDDDVTIIEVLEEIGLADRAERCWALRMSVYARSKYGRLPPSLGSAETMALVFGVKPRIVNYIWAGRYWNAKA